MDRNTAELIWRGVEPAIPLFRIFRHEGRIFIGRAQDRKLLLVLPEERLAELLPALDPNLAAYLLHLNEQAGLARYLDDHEHGISNLKLEIEL